MKKTNQSGRSIVEMLGVLALIGLFSYGGVIVFKDAITTLRAKYIAEQVRLRVDEAASAAELSKGHKKQVYTPEYINKTDAGAYGYSFATKDITVKPHSLEYYLAENRAATTVDVIVCCGDIKVKMDPDKGNAIYECDQKCEISKTVCKKVLSRLELVGMIQKVNGKTLSEFECSDENVSSLTLMVGKNDKNKVSSTTSTPGGSGTPVATEITCGEKQYKNASGTCEDCPAHSISCTSLTDFVCETGYYKNGTTCTKCPDHTTSCNSDTDFVCESGYYKTALTCKKCPANSEPNEAQDSCVCKTGFIFQEAGVCCPTGATCTKVGEDFKVSCPAGKYLSEKNCLSCPTNATCAGGDALPKCGSGFLFVQDSCQQTKCVQGEAGRYRCYINGKMCGYYCTDTNMNEGSCRGYCSDTFCPADTTWGNVVVGWSGFGCADNKTGIYCGTVPDWGGNTKWLCTEKKDSGTVCCSGAQFGKCISGTCTRSDCDQFKSVDTTSEWVYVADRAYGCKITKNGASIYCIPQNSGASWYCKKSPSNSWTPGYCGTCSTDALKNGTGCSDCFDSSTNCANWAKTDPNVKWNGTLQACVGKGSDGNTYSCQLNGYCYLGEGTTQRCGIGCNSITPDSCDVDAGLCNQDKCPSGTTYFYNSKLNYGGCKTAYTGTEGGYLFYRPGGWSNYPCYHGKTENSISSLCGYGCQTSKNCSDCATPLMSQCVQTNCSQNGMEIKNCTCTGQTSNNHCCPPGHTYLNGACSIVDMTNKCLYRGQNIVEETADYKADSASNCTCVDEVKCLDESSFTTPQCKTTGTTLRRDKKGICTTCMDEHSSTTVVAGNQIGTTGCYCESGYYVNGTACAKCPDNSTCTNASSFTCKTGFYKKNNVCATCPTENVKTCSGDSFTCNDGFTPSENACIPSSADNCPTGSTYDGNATNPAQALETGHCTCNLADNSQCGGKNSDYYCAFDSRGLSCTADSGNALEPSTGSGTCESITKYRGSAISGVGTKKGKNGLKYNGTDMDWWSANAWCVAKGTSGLYDAGCGASCPWRDVYDYVAVALSGVSGCYWLKNLRDSNSCQAFFVCNGSYVTYLRRDDNNYSALCAASS